MKPSVRKLLSLFITVTYFTTQVALGAVAESNVWAERKKKLRNSDFGLQIENPQSATRNPQYAGVPASLLNQMPSVGSTLPSTPQWPSIRQPKNGPRLPKQLETVLASIPLNHATVQEVHDSQASLKDSYAGAGPVVLIQDVHLNTEAQMNIAAVLQQLINDGQAGMVGVEGAFTAFDFKPFRRFPNKEINRAVAEDFLKKNLMAAPSLVGITSPTEPPAFIGVDDPVHYRANVEALLDSREQKEKVSKELQSRKQELLGSKKKIFSTELRSFDDLRNAYHAGTVGFGVYVRKLSAVIPAKAGIQSSNLFQRNVGDLDPGFRRDDSIGHFLEAYQLEQSLDFNRVDHERRSVMEKLTRKLSQQEISELVQQSLAYRLGRLGFGDYYRNLQDLCAAKGVSLAQAPAFESYIRYVLLSDGIKSEALFAAVSALEDQIAAQLAVTPEEKKLLAESDHLALTQKLVNFELTPREWERYQEFRIADFGLRIEPFEEFYQQADIRSREILKNLLAFNPQSEIRNPQCLIVGGFHTPEITKLLRQQKVSYAVVSPKITKIDSLSGSAYLSVFSRDKTPLDRLFAGEKLFLASSKGSIGNPIAGGANALEESITAFENGMGRPSVEIEGRAYDLVDAAKAPADAGLLFHNTKVIPARGLKVTGQMLRSVIKSIPGTVWLVRKFRAATKDAGQIYRFFLFTVQYRKAHREIERQLGRPLNEVFSRVSRIPSGVGHYGGVYKGYLNDGKNTPVAIKVNLPFNKPGSLQPSDPFEAARSHMALHTMDFRHEAVNLRNYSSMDSTVEVPRVIESIPPTPNLLVTTFVSARGLLRTPLEMRRRAEHLIAVDFFHRAFSGNPFHGDLMAANMGVRTDGTPVLFDFGRIGELPQPVAASVKNLAQGTKGGAEALAQVLRQGMEQGEISNKAYPFHIGMRKLIRTFGAEIVDEALAEELNGGEKIQGGHSNTLTSVKNTFRFPEYIWVHFQKHLRNLDNDHPGIYEQVKNNGLAWTDEKGNLHWAEEYLGWKKAELVWEAARLALNEAHGWEEGFWSEGNYIASSHQVKYVVKLHENQHNRLRMSQAASIIPTFRTYLERQVFQEPLTPRHPFIRTFVEVYGKPHGREALSDIDHVNWVLEEFLVLTIQEAEQFIDTERVFNLMEEKNPELSVHAELILQGARTAAKWLDEKAVLTLREEFRDFVNNPIPHFLLHVLSHFLPAPLNFMAIGGLYGFFIFHMAFNRVSTLLRGRRPEIQPQAWLFRSDWDMSRYEPIPPREGALFAYGVNAQSLRGILQAGGKVLPEQELRKAGPVYLSADADEMPVHTQLVPAFDLATRSILWIRDAEQTARGDTPIDLGDGFPVMSYGVHPENIDEAIEIHQQKISYLQRKHSGRRDIGRWEGRLAELETLKQSFESMQPEQKDQIVFDSEIPVVVIGTAQQEFIRPGARKHSDDRSHVDQIQVTVVATPAGHLEYVESLLHDSQRTDIRVVPFERLDEVNIRSEFRSQALSQLENMPNSIGYMRELLYGDGKMDDAVSSGWVSMELEVVGLSVISVLFLVSQALGWDAVTMWWAATVAQSSLLMAMAAYHAYLYRQLMIKWQLQPSWKSTAGSFFNFLFWFLPYLLPLASKVFISDVLHLNIDSPSMVMLADTVFIALMALAAFIHACYDFWRMEKAAASFHIDARYYISEASIPGALFNFLLGGLLRMARQRAEFWEARRIISKTYGRPGWRFKHMFKTFNPIPAGEGTFSRVYEATLNDEQQTAVMVKVITSNSRLKMMQAFSDRNADEALLNAYENGLDLRREHQSLQEFAQDATPDVIIPRLLPQFPASEKVLVETRVSGRFISDRVSYSDRLRAARAVYLQFLDRALTGQTFHADLMRTNVRISDNGEAVILDFGLIGQLTPAEVEAVKALFQAVVTEDRAQVIAGLNALSNGTGTLTEQHIDAVFAQNFSLLATFSELLHVTRREGATFSPSVRFFNSNLITLNVALPNMMFRWVADAVMELHTGSDQIMTMARERKERNDRIRLALDPWLEEFLMLMEPLYQERSSVPSLTGGARLSGEEMLKRLGEATSESNRTLQLLNTLQAFKLVLNLMSRDAADQTERQAQILEEMRSAPLLDVGAGRDVEFVRFLVDELGFDRNQVRATDPAIVESSMRVEEQPYFRRASAEEGFPVELGQELDGTTLSFFVFNPEYTEAESLINVGGIDVLAAAQKIKQNTRPGGLIIIFAGGTGATPLALQELTYILGQPNITLSASGRRILNLSGIYVFRNSETPAADLPEFFNPAAVVFNKNETPVEIKFQKNVSLPHHPNPYDSYCLLYGGQLITPAILNTMDMKTMVDVLNRASREIGNQPEIRAFQSGDLDAAEASNAMVLATQYLEIGDRLDDLAEAATVEGLGALLNYVFDAQERRKPFSHIVNGSLFTVALNQNRERFYEALEKRKESLSDAVATIKDLPYVSIVMLDRSPTVRDLREFFVQGDQQAELSIVINDQGRAFLVRGMGPTTASITYRNFRDVAIDLHTHSVDWSFSTSDINTFRSLTISRDIYSVKNQVSFHVRSPRGIFTFHAKNQGGILDRIDRDQDAYLMPCTVRYSAANGEARQQRFEVYTNHNKGSSGRYITSAITGGARELSVTFDDGDEIQFYPWSYFQERGWSDLPFNPAHQLQRNLISQPSKANLQNELRRLEEELKSLRQNGLPQQVFLGDVHANPTVLKRVLALVRGKQIDRVIFHGDLFNKGAGNLECLQLIHEIQTMLGDNFVGLMGNHDATLISALLLSNDRSYKALEDHVNHTIISEVVGSAGREEARQNPQLQEAAFWLLKNLRMLHVDGMGYLHNHGGLNINNKGYVEFEDHQPEQVRAALNEFEERWENLQARLSSVKDVEQNAAEIKSLLLMGKQLYDVERADWTDRLSQRDRLNKVLRQLGIRGVVFGHQSNHRFMEWFGRIFCVDAIQGGEQGFVRFLKDAMWWFPGGRQPKILHGKEHFENQILEDIRLVQSQLGEPVVEDKMTVAAGWLADTAAKLARRDISGLVAINSFEIGDLPRPRFSNEAAVVAQLNKWTSGGNRKKFEKLLIQAIRERVPEMNAAEADELAEVVTAVVAGQSHKPTRVKGTIGFAFQADMYGKGRSLTRMEVMAAVQKAGSNKVQVFADEDVMELVDSAMETLAKYGLRPYIKPESLGAEPLGQVRSLLRAGHVTEFVVPAKLKARIPDRRAITLDKFIPSIQLMDLNNLTKFIRAALVAA